MLERVCNNGMVLVGSCGCGVVLTLDAKDTKTGGFKFRLLCFISIRVNCFYRYESFSVILLQTQPATIISYNTRAGAKSSSTTQPATVISKVRNLEIFKIRKRVA